MNLKIIYNTWNPVDGIIGCSRSDNRTVIGAGCEIARLESPDAQRHVIASVRLIGTINIIVPTIYHL